MQKLYPLLLFKQIQRGCQSNNETDIVIKDEAIDDDDIGQSEGITYEDVGGIGQQLQKVREMN